MPDQAGGVEIGILGDPENGQLRRQCRHQMREEGGRHGAGFGLDTCAFHSVQHAQWQASAKRGINGAAIHRQHPMARRRSERRDLVAQLGEREA